MRFYIIAALVALPLLILFSLLSPLLTGATEKPIGPQAAEVMSETGDPARGESLYRSKCFGCHAPEAKIGPVYNTLDFALEYANDETITLVVRSGRQPMPAFTERMLAEQGLADIIAYVRTLAPAP